MASRLIFFILAISSILMAIGSQGAEPYLTLDYYKSSCPSVLDIVKKEMECAVLSDPRNAATILRLHFHDCFVQVSARPAIDSRPAFLGSTYGWNTVIEGVTIDNNGPGPVIYLHEYHARFSQWSCYNDGLQPRGMVLTQPAQ